MRSTLSAVRRRAAPPQPERGRGRRRQGRSYRSTFYTARESSRSSRPACARRHPRATGRRCGGGGARARNRRGQPLFRGERPARSQRLYVLRRGHARRLRRADRERVCALRPRHARMRRRKMARPCPRLRRQSRRTRAHVRGGRGGGGEARVRGAHHARGRERSGRHAPARGRPYMVARVARAP